jgi:hypothetical protein
MEENMFKRWLFVLIAVMFATSAFAAKDKTSQRFGYYG